MDGKMEKQHLFIYSERTPCTEMPTQKYLGQHITNELGIFLLLCHSHTQKLQHSGRNKEQEDTTELSRSPLLEAAAVTELPMPAGTANPNHLLKCDHKHKAAPV